MNQSASKHGQNLVVFPREYVIDQDSPEKSLVHGVDAQGLPVTVSLKLPEEYLASIAAQGSKVPPSLYEFSRTGRKARTPCIADPENGPASETREGVLLFSKAFQSGETTWDAGWAVVLAADAESPMPQLGLGRVENRFIARFESDAVKALRSQLDATRAASANPKEDPAVLQLEDQLAEQQEVKMAAILDLVEWTTSHQGWDAVQAAALEAMARHTHAERGTYGGATLRLRAGNVTVREFQGSPECGLYKGTPVTPEMAWTNFMNWGGGKRMKEAFAKLQQRHPDAVVDVIPYELFNFGPQGNAMFKKPREWRAFQNTYTDHNDRSVSMVCPLAIRPFVIEDGRFAGNMIVSNVYAIGPQRGSILTLDANGERRFTPTPLATLMEMSAPSPV